MDFGEPKPERIERFKEVIANKQFDLTVVLENVHDPHNVGAVLRTCDAVGISEIYMLYTDKGIDTAKFKIGKSSSTGVKKWIKSHFFENVKDCFETVNAKYKNTYGTHLSTEAVDLHSIDLADSCALVFGNERDGLSTEALTYCDGNFLIPQYGMVQSLNISVACAVTLYEACRQRKLASKYNNPFDAAHSQQQSLLKSYVAKHHAKRMNKMLNRKPI